MIEPANLPTQVLVKIATLEAGCTSLGTKLETARRDLQRLRIELRDLAPRTVYDEAGANLESERLILESERLNAAINAQAEICERLERRLCSEERIVRECKTFLHELPEGARLRVVDGKPGDVDDIRQRIDAVKAEIAQVQRTPVLSGDLGAKIADYVADLGHKARPLIAGTGDAESLRVLFPLHDHADRVTQSGFSQHEGNALLMFALLDGKRLAEKLLQVATETGISSNERSLRLQALQAEMVTLRYDEEAAIGDDVVRSSSAPPWAVLQVSVEHEQKQAAA